MFFSLFSLGTFAQSREDMKGLFDKIQASLQAKPIFQTPSSPEDFFLLLNGTANSLSNESMPLDATFRKDLHQVGKLMDWLLLPFNAAAEIVIPSDLLNIPKDIQFENWEDARKEIGKQITSLDFKGENSIEIMLISLSKSGDLFITLPEGDLYKLKDMYLLLNRQKISAKYQQYVENLNWRIQHDYPLDKYFEVYLGQTLQVEFFNFLEIIFTQVSEFVDQKFSNAVSTRNKLKKDFLIALFSSANIEDFLPSEHLTAFENFEKSIGEEGFLRENMKWYGSKVTDFTFNQTKNSLQVERAEYLSYKAKQDRLNLKGIK